MAIVISRFAGGVSLNGKEFILNERGDVMKFNTKEDALAFINEATDNTLTIEQWEEDGVFFTDWESEYL